MMNHANFQSPLDNNALFEPSGTPLGGAGAIDHTVNDSREIQFGLKFLW